MYSSRLHVSSHDDPPTRRSSNTMILQHGSHPWFIYNRDRTVTVPPGENSPPLSASRLSDSKENTSTTNKDSLARRCHAPTRLEEDLTEAKSSLLNLSLD